MGLRHIIKLFENHSVCVVGMKGTGKDLLMGNVVVRRKLPYVSNTDYGSVSSCRLIRDKFIRWGQPNLLMRFPLDLEALKCGGNTYQNFLKNNLYRYFYPYPDFTDIYLGDAGVYFPAQYCNELNRDCKEIPLLAALTRQLGNGTKIHVNCQNLNRIWDKLREMADRYILCRWCWYIPKLNIVVQLVTEYDKYDSCVARIEPCRVRAPLFGKEPRMDVTLYKDNFFNQHGTVKNRLLIYRNKAKYDTRVFKRKLENAVDD